MSTKILCAVLIVLMSATTFTTQKQLMSKNMPADAMNNPFAQQQKILLYVFPLVFAVSGVNFPVGVLLYWLTTNVWSMGQQFYVIRRNPAPGSPAAEALERRKAAKEAHHKATAAAAERADGDGGAVATDGSAEGSPGGCRDAASRRPAPAAEAQEEARCAAAPARPAGLGLVTPHHHRRTLR